MNRKIIIASLVFTLLAVTYFLPGSLLSAFLSSVAVKFRIAYPVAVLCIGGLIAGMDWRFALAFLFSCTGDAFGAAGSFLGQMGFFALAHITLIFCFIRRLRKIARERAGAPDGPRQAATAAREGEACEIARAKVHFPGGEIIGLTIVAAIFILACVFVLPRIDNGFLVWGCGIYALLICTMATLAMLQRSPLFALGALLFAVSDLILSWNKFVGPVAFEKYLIMLPYYLGQLLLWLGALKKARKALPENVEGEAESEIMDGAELRSRGEKVVVREEAQPVMLAEPDAERETVAEIKTVAETDSA